MLGSEFFPCTCDRGCNNKMDVSDLFVIREFYKKGRRNSRVYNSTFSQVVCMRPGCKGYYKTRASYVDKIPMIAYNDWLKQKRLQNDNYENNSKDSS